MKHIIIIPLLALAACSKSTPIDEQHAAIQTQIDALEHSLAPECKTEGIQTQLDALRTQVATQVSVCYASLHEEQVKTTKANIRFFTLLVILAGLVFVHIKQRGVKLWS